MNIFYDAVAPYLNTPRDLVRLFNAMSVSWPAVANEIDIGDFVSLEVMRLFEPSLYNAIRTEKETVCGVSLGYGSQDDSEKEINKFLGKVPDKNREQTKIVLERLFPRFENMGYGSDWLSQWDAQRRVCSHRHFDTYFRLTIGMETLSATEIDEFIEHCGDANYVKEAFLKASRSIRKKGKSKVPLLFDEINVHASRIEKEKIQPFICAMFEIADDIYRVEDRESAGSSLGDSHLRIRWLIRKLTFERCNLNERSEVFMSACKNAQVGWLVDFTRSAISDHFPSEGTDPKPDEACLVKKENMSELKSHTLRSIEAAAATGKMIDHPLLRRILFQWKDLAEDGYTRVKNWVNSQFQDDKSLAKLTKVFTGESWSHSMGMFGLGDRVAMRNFEVSVSSLEEIVDIKGFRRRLEEIEKSNTLDKEYLDHVLTFLEAWRKQETSEIR